ncbi:MAG: nucleoside recognition domain-containing protein [Clostridia bacterium]|nr:nucleoside recognition domain-containing protein [Clostridia bacterium]
MQNFGFYVVPAIIFLIICYALSQKTPIFNEFLSGAEEGFKSTISLVPTLVALVTGISMLKASGTLEIFSSVLQPICDFLKIPPQIAPLALMRPISGSGSTALLDNIFTHYGPDSLIGTIASMIMGSTETTFYTLTVYFGAVKIKNTRHALFCSVLADLCAIIMAILVSKFLVF